MSETAIEAEFEVVEQGRPHVRHSQAAKAALQADYFTGKGSLADLSERHGIPYQTVRDWSHKEKWGEERGSSAQIIQTEIKHRLQTWIAEQQTEQVKRAITRSLKVQGALDVVLDAGGQQVVTDDGEAVLVPLDAKALQCIATAEDRLDLIIRRNLGMESESGGANGGKVSINILSNNLEISG